MSEARQDKYIHHSNTRPFLVQKDIKRKINRSEHIVNLLKSLKVYSPYMNRS